MKIGDSTWLDWGNVPGLLDWIAFGLGIIGFIIAFCQLRKTRNSFESAKRAVEQTRKDLIYKRLTSSAKGLESMAQVFGRAVDENDKLVAAHILNNYASNMGDFRALLVQSGYNTEDFLSELDVTAAGIATMRATIYRTNSPSLSEAFVERMEPLYALTEKISAVSTNVQVAADGVLASEKKRKKWWKLGEGRND